MKFGRKKYQQMDPVDEFYDKLESLKTNNKRVNYIISRLKLINDIDFQKVLVYNLTRYHPASGFTFNMQNDQGRNWDIIGNRIVILTNTVPVKAILPERMGQYDWLDVGMTPEELSQFLSNPRRREYHEYLYQLRDSY